jgi:hypothetical protein
VSLLVAAQATCNVMAFRGDMIGTQAIQAMPNYVCGDRVVRWRQRWRGARHSLPLGAPGYHLPAIGLSSRGQKGWIHLVKQHF